jgi:hypothetical protein
MNKSWGNMASVLAVAVLLALFSQGPFPAQATTYWDVDEGDWHDAGNWTAGVPNSTTDAVIDNGGEVQSLSADAEARNLSVGVSNEDWLWYYDNHSLTVHGNLVAGDQAGSRGYVYLSDDIHVKGNLILGQQARSRGYFGGDPEMGYFYTLTVGQETDPGNLIVGAGGLGGFHLGSSDLTVHGDVIVGDQAGSLGFFSSNTYGTASITGDFILGNQAGSSGFLRMKLGAMTIGQDMVVGGSGTGEVRTGSLGSEEGYGLNLTVNGDLIVGDLTGSHGSVGTYDHGDRFHIKGDLILGKQAGSFGDLLFQSSLTVGEAGAPANMIVGAGGEGHLDMWVDMYSRSMTVHGNLIFGEQGHFSAVPGATINMTGGRFDNRSTTPANLSDLGNLKLIYTGGLVTEDPFEVAGHDLGLVPAGFTNNFVLGTLQLGDATHTAYVGLYDVFDNSLGEPGGSEALYVNWLILNDASILDLHGLNLYCQSFTNRGGKILNGKIRVVPLPGSLLFLGSGLLGLGLLGLRRKRG